MTSPDTHPMTSSTTTGAMASVDLRDLHAANIARQAEWCPDQVPDLSFRGNELAGETGEACNIVKKLERERHGWRGSRATIGDLAEELADVVICADLCAVTAGIDLGAAVVSKFNATSEKQGLATKLRAAALAAPAPVVPEEAWRPVSVAPHYRVSDLGRIKNTLTNTIVTLRYGDGYLHATLLLKAKMPKSFRVSRLVLEAFVGPAPEDRPQAGHLNGIRDDNRLGNLAWISREENEQHKIIHGTALLGPKHHQSKLDWDKVRDIRKRHGEGVAVKRLARDHGVDPHAIRFVVQNKTWVPRHG